MRLASGPALVGEDAPLDPRNAYATTKLAQEHLAAAWARETGGQRWRCATTTSTGRGCPGTRPTRGWRRSSAPRWGRPGPAGVRGRGQRRDFVHVRDVAAANLAALTGGRPGRRSAYNVASGEPHTVGEMAAALAEDQGGPAPVITGEYRLGDVRHIVALPDLAAKELGFHARIGFAEGMRSSPTRPGLTRVARPRAAGRQEGGVVHHGEITRSTRPLPPSSPCAPFTRARAPGPAAAGR